MLRWDQDAITAKVDAASLLAKVQAHEVDVIVGTQMVAKGLDLPLVTSIGVIDADTLYDLPDFRAGDVPSNCSPRWRVARADAGRAVA